MDIERAITEPMVRLNQLQTHINIETKVLTVALNCLYERVENSSDDRKLKKLIAEAFSHWSHPPVWDSSSPSAAPTSYQ